MEEDEINEYDLEEPAAEPAETGEARPEEQALLAELNGKYLRLYAEFDNYRKRVNKDKEEQARYCNESLLFELLPVVDSMELALKHAPEEAPGILQGVRMTLKELQRTLEKFGATKIDAAGKEFDPSVHHAMTQIVREDMEEKMVAEEFRAGYMYRDKVLRPSLVAVSVRPQPETISQMPVDADNNSNEINNTYEEDQ